MHKTHICHPTISRWSRWLESRGTSFRPHQGMLLASSELVIAGDWERRLTGCTTQSIRDLKVLCSKVMYSDLHHLWHMFWLSWCNLWFVLLRKDIGLFRASPHSASPPSANRQDHMLTVFFRRDTRREMHESSKALALYQQKCTLDVTMWPAWILQWSLQ